MNHYRSRTARIAPRGAAFRQAIILLVPVFFALGEWYLSGTARQTFVFYPPATLETAPGSEPPPGTVEERMIGRDRPDRDRPDPDGEPRAGSARVEAALRRHAEETLLGPVSPDLEPLFPPETRLRSLFFRDGTLYLDLSRAAALAKDPWRSLLTLNRGIRRNFPQVREINIFMEGNSAFYGTFHEFFERKTGDSNKSSETH